MHTSSQRALRKRAGARMRMLAPPLRPHAQTGTPFLHARLAEQSIIAPPATHLGTRAGGKWPPCSRHFRDVRVDNAKWTCATVREKMIVWLSGRLRT
eukprot:6200702-Pleurochrysis_carterae.AAC.1